MEEIILKIKLHFAKFFIRLDWPLFRPAAALNPEPLNPEPLNAEPLNAYNL
jgi:hypothetical protein